jgi:hypothetical protein
LNNGSPAWGDLGDRNQPQQNSWNQQGAGGWNGQSRHDGNGRTENYQGQTNNSILEGGGDHQPSQETPFPVQNTNSETQRGAWNKESEDKELAQPSKRCKELMSINNWNDRLEAFGQLEMDHKKTLFMWHQDGEAELPPLYVPGDWDEREKRAVQDTINHIRDPEVAESKLGVSVEKPNSDSEDSYADMNGVKPMQEYEDFVRALPLCIPMTIGFHAVFLHGDNAWCYCPCGRHMKKWKSF